MLTYEVARDMAAQQIRYAELTITPYSSVHRGIAAEAFLEAIEDARLAAERELGIVLRWCFDIPGEAGLPAAAETARIATELQAGRPGQLRPGRPGDRRAAPPVRPYFDAARAIGLHSVPHAGETTGPGTIWDAIRVLGAERIGHGTSAVQDPRLLDYLAEHQIALEVCPTSNIATRAVPELAQHPLAELVAAGVPVTINSDDPPMFSTDLNSEYAIAAELLEPGPGRRRGAGRQCGHRLVRPGRREVPGAGRDRELHRPSCAVPEPLPSGAGRCRGRGR